MQETISVIVPVYKVEPYLMKCVDSILTQTYQNLEIILVDDGSPDNCGKICDDLAAKDSRVKVIHQENAGVSAARNAALQIATGEYVTFLDADDYFPEDALQALYRRMVQDGSDMAIGMHSLVYEDDSCDECVDNWMRDAVYSGVEILSQMHGDHQYSVGIMAKMYRKEIFQGIVYPKLICGEDLCVFPLLVEKCRKVSVVARNVYYYLQRSSSAVHRTDARTATDSLEATLFMTKQLLRHQLYRPAAAWFAFCVFKAFWLENTADARRLMKEYIPLFTSVRLLLQQKPKTWALWLALYVPVLKIMIRQKVHSNQQHRGEM